MKKAVVLHSGGLDSTTILAIARAEGFTCYPLFLNYGQRHIIEEQCAQKVLDFYALEGKVAHLDVSLFGNCSLTDPSMDIPHDALGQTSLPTTYVPARNFVFLAMATAYAETIGAYAIFIGVNNVDYSGYPDCRPDFIQACEKCSNLATRAVDDPQHRYTIYAPLQHLSKSQIIQRATALHAPLHLTHSCYNPTPNGTPCGHCDSCLLRAEGFAQAGIRDPALGPL